MSECSRCPRRCCSTRPTGSETYSFSSIEARIHLGGTPARPEPTEHHPRARFLALGWTMLRRIAIARVLLPEVVHHHGRSGRGNGLDTGVERVGVEAQARGEL